MFRFISPKLAADTGCAVGLYRASEKILVEVVLLFHALDVGSEDLAAYPLSTLSLGWTPLSRLFEDSLTVQAVNSEENDEATEL